MTTRLIGFFLAFTVRVRSGGFPRETGFSSTPLPETTLDKGVIALSRCPESEQTFFLCGHHIFYTWVYLRSFSVTNKYLFCKTTLGHPEKIKRRQPTRICPLGQGCKCVSIRFRIDTFFLPVRICLLIVGV